MAENRVIGRQNALPWRLPADLRHFRKLTTGHTVIMGRRNFESIGRPLPDRRNVIITRDVNFSAPGCLIAHSVEQALSLADPDDPEIFIIGGEQIYRETLPVADRLYLTLVHARVPGDRFFPEFDSSQWHERTRECHEADARHEHAYSFIVLERAGPIRRSVS